VLYLNCDLPDATRQAHIRHPDGSIMELQMPDEGKGGMLPLMAEIINTINDPKNDIIRTVVVDPVGELYRRLLEDLSSRAVRPSLNQYGDAGTHLERFCRSLCRSPVNAVLCAHEWGYEKAGDEGMEMGIWTGTRSNSTSIGQKIMGMVNIIGYTGRIEQEDHSVRWVAQLVTGRGRQGGDRFAALDPIEDVDIEAWIAKIKNHEARASSPSSDGAKGEVAEPVTEPVVEAIKADSTSPTPTPRRGRARSKN
jgi:hypothetical protein